MKLYILLFISIVSLTLSCSDERTAQEIITAISDNTKNGNFNSLNCDYTLLIDKFPTYSHAYYVIAKSQSKTGKNEEAILNFKKALDLDSLNHVIYIERAKLKIKLGDNNGAISDCLDAIRINGKYSYAFSTMALAYENLNEIGNAIYYYEKAKLYDIQNGNVHYKLGMLYLSYGETNKGCQNLSKAGELGIMAVFDIINTNCNFIREFDSVVETIQNPTGQYKYYPGKFSINFPISWKINETWDSNNTLLNVIAQKDGHFMIIHDQNPKIFDLNFNTTSIWNLDKDKYFLDDYRKKYKDFKLLEFDEIMINGVEAHYFKMSYSFFDEISKTNLSSIQYVYTLINPVNHIIYYYQGTCKDNEVKEFDEIYRKTFETLKLM